jgi:pilus assembly protein CpaB
MKRVVVIVVVVILLLVGVAAGLYFFGPEELKQQIGLGEPTATPEGPAPEPTADPGVDIVVARIDLPIGTYISDTQTLLDVSNISTLRYEERAEKLFRAAEIGDIREKVLKVPLFAGDPFEKDFLGEPGLSQRIPVAEPNTLRDKAFPMEVDKFTGVADQIMVGDTVDIVVTFKVQRRIYLPPSQSVVGVRDLSIGMTVEDDAGDNADAAATTAQDQAAASVSRPVETREFITTKTIVQQAQVLSILRPPPPTPVPVAAEDEEPDPDNPPPPTPVEEEPSTSGAPPKTVTEGTWLVVLALSNQEVEMITFAQQSEAKLSLVLRGAGDKAYEPTQGTSFDLMFSEFGLPMPQPDNPFVFSADVLTPEPTRTPSTNTP